MERDQSTPRRKDDPRRKRASGLSVQVTLSHKDMAFAELWTSGCQRTSKIGENDYANHNP
jgi:hypothetical protein